jgi:hypothetical protein
MQPCRARHGDYPRDEWPCKDPRPLALLHDPALLGVETVDELRQEIDCGRFDAQPFAYVFSSASVALRP